MAPRSDSFTILSLSGGGYFGLFTITLLADLEEALGAPIARHFDLIAGTSVGGIIALGLAQEIPARAMQRAFEEKGPAIFSERPAPQGPVSQIADLLRCLCKAKYRPDPLRNTIIDFVGADTRLGDLKHPVIIPAINLTTGQPQLFRTPHHESFHSDMHLKAVDVALATAAAPAYFPIAEVEGQLFTDGGLYANAPDLLAVHEAEHFLQRPTEQIRVLSIGTMTAHFSFGRAFERNLGALGWLRDQRLVDLLIAAQQQWVQMMMEHRLGPRYLRLDAAQPEEERRHLALDVATPQAQRIIKSLAQSIARSALQEPLLKEIMSHTALWTGEAWNT